MANQADKCVPYVIPVFNGITPASFKYVTALMKRRTKELVGGLLYEVKSYGIDQNARIYYSHD